MRKFIITAAFAFGLFCMAQAQVSIPVSSTPDPVFDGDEPIMPFSDNQTNKPIFKLFGIQDYQIDYFVVYQNGRILYQSNDQTTLNNLPPGIYVLEIHTTNVGIVVETFVKA
ncbi:MAG: hypothetical protein FWF54_06210 [Candidatus Azobacteroides sp.]|nr:hypothetical protein [Candidatus Azobacteroides sp.]